jgi:hypothetical protein
MLHWQIEFSLPIAAIDTGVDNTINAYVFKALKSPLAVKILSDLIRTGGYSYR